MSNNVVVNARTGEVSEIAMTPQEEAAFRASQAVSQANFEAAKAGVQLGIVRDRVLDALAGGETPNPADQAKWKNRPPGVGRGRGPNP